MAKKIKHTIQIELTNREARYLYWGLQDRLNGRIKNYLESYPDKGFFDFLKEEELGEEELDLIHMVGILGQHLHSDPMKEFQNQFKESQ